MFSSPTPQVKQNGSWRAADTAKQCALLHPWESAYPRRSALLLPKADHQLGAIGRQPKVPRQWPVGSHCLHPMTCLEASDSIGRVGRPRVLQVPLKFLGGDSFSRLVYADTAVQLCSQGFFRATLGCG
jgi:hypothetical protein